MTKPTGKQLRAFQKAERRLKRVVNSVAVGSDLPRRLEVEFFAAAYEVEKKGARFGLAPR